MTDDFIHIVLYILFIFYSYFQQEIGEKQSDFHCQKQKSASFLKNKNFIFECLLDYPFSESHWLHYNEMIDSNR